MNVHTDPKGKLFTDLVTKQEIKALIQTVTHLIQGNLHVHPGIRPLDELNRSGEFIAITQATVLGPDGKELYRADFLAQGKSHIVWVLPIDELGESDTLEEAAPLQEAALAGC